MNNFTGKEWLQNSFTIWRDIRKSSEERKLKHPAMFPVELAEKLIKIYTKDEGEIILDPFLGVGSTLLAAINLDRKGIGFDISEEFVGISKKRISELAKNIKTERGKIFDSKIYKENSLELDKYVKPASVDLSISSPPYWNILNQKRTADFKEIRHYGNGTADLGNIDDYDQFLKELKGVYEKVYTALKPNKRCCVIVMDIRKKDKFYPLHLDLTNIMREIGFELEEFAIWDRQHEYNNMKTLGYPWVFRFNKVHEFICIYWKR